jgi:hypothetical protein
MKYILKKILNIGAKETKVTPRYESVILDKGNGEWYHGNDNPLEHKWIVKGNLAICSICLKRVERRIVNEG